MDIEIHLLCGLLFGHEDRNSTSDAPGISSEIFSGAFFWGLRGPKRTKTPKVSAISSQHAPAQRQLGRTADHGVAQCGPFSTRGVRGAGAVMCRPSDFGFCKF